MFRRLWWGTVCYSEGRWDWFLWGGTRDAHKCKDGGTPGVTSATAPPTVEQDKLLGRSLMEIATRQTNTKRKCPTDVHLLIDSQQVQIFFFSGGSEKKGASRGRPYASTLGWCSLNKQPQEMYAILFKDTGKTEEQWCFKVLYLFVFTDVSSRFSGS